MKQFGKILGLGLGFGILAAVLGSIPSRPVIAAGGAPVMVTNIPLPVSGTVGVNNFPVTQSVSGTVGINNFPSTQNVSLGAGSSVNVTNPPGSPLLVRDVDNPGRHRFQVGTTCTAFAGSFACIASFAVPANKLLVIETVSADVAVPAGEKVQVVWTIVQGSSMVAYPSPVQLNGTFFTRDSFSAMFAVRLYADPGTTVNVTLGRNDSTGNGDLGAFISGYLVDCGTGSGCPLP